MGDNELLHLHIEEDRINFGGIERTLRGINAKLDLLTAEIISTRTELTGIKHFYEKDWASVQRRLEALESRATAGETQSATLKERLTWPAIITSVCLSVAAVIVKLL